MARRSMLNVPFQVFNGVNFYLHNGQHYFKGAQTRMHLYVWRFYNGPIPKGYHIHHKDKNKHNNLIENLECLPGSKHLSDHGKESWLTTAEGKEHIARNQELAKDWHKSEAGLKWHRTHAANMGFGKQEYGAKNCQVCTKPFTARKKDQVFCSNNCKTRARVASGIDNEERTCIRCGNSFTKNKYAKAACCSRSCAKKKNAQAT